MALGSGGGGGGGDGGGGGSSSSSSNLSALAPPFTVDRFNSKSNSNPLLHFNDSPYAAGPFTHAWQYTQHPSAPGPDVFSNPELDVDSMNTNSMPLSNDYLYSVPEPVNPTNTQWSGLQPNVKSSTNTFTYVTEAKSYYPPYVSSVVCKDSPLLSLSGSSYDPLSPSGLGNISSRVDYTESLSGLEYLPQWEGVWNGLPDAKRGKQVESGGSFSLEKLNFSSPLLYNNYINRDPAVESEGLSRGDSTILYGKLPDGVQRESHTGSFNVGKSDDNFLFAQKIGSETLYGKSADGIGKESCSGSFSSGNVDDELLAQNVDFHPFEYSSAQFVRSPGPFQESSKNFFNYQKTCGPHETCIQMVDSFVQDSASSVKPPGAVVITEPDNGTTSSLRDPVSHETVSNGNVSKFCSELLNHPNPSKVKQPHLSLSPESKQGSFNTSALDAPKEGNNCILSASCSIKELLSKPQYRDSLNQTLKRRYASQVTDTNVSSGLSPSLDHVQPFKYTENPSDSFDNHNLAVDSPCWKGAPAAHYSPHDVVKPFTPRHSLQKLEGCHNLNTHGNQNGHKTGCTGNDKSPSPKCSDSSFPAKEHWSADAAKEVFICPQLSSSKAGKFPNDSEKPKKGFNLSNNSLGSLTQYSCSSQPYFEEDGFASVKVNLHADLEDGGINFNDASEGGAAAYHAAENVLRSPSAQEESAEHDQPSGRVATPNMDVPTLIKAIHNLSELLRSNCSTDSCGLKEQDQEVLKRVISNVDACMSMKIANYTPAPKPMFPGQDTSGKIEETHDLHVGKCADQPQQKYQGTVSSYCEIDHQYMHTQKMNYSESHKKAEYIPCFLPLGDKVCISNDDGMVQAIKKVLDENLTFEEKMLSQSLLFKDLWLEAEAKLCSISYRAQFDRMRIQMEEYKSNRKKEIAADVEKASGSNESPDLKETSTPASLAEDGSMLEGTTANHSTFSANSYADDVEASVLARSNILKHRDDKFNTEVQQLPDIVDNRKAECQFGSSVVGFDSKRSIANHSTFSTKSHANDVEAAVLARFNILKCRDDTSNIEEQQPLMVDTGNAVDVAEGEFGSSIGGSGYESEKEFRLSVTNDPVIQPGRNGRFGNQHSSEWYDNSSSDWEHVLKDEFTWQKR